MADTAVAPPTEAPIDHQDAVPASKANTAAETAENSTVEPKIETISSSNDAANAAGPTQESANGSNAAKEEGRPEGDVKGKDHQATANGSDAVKEEVLKEEEKPKADVKEKDHLGERDPQRHGNDHRHSKHGPNNYKDKPFRDYSKNVKSDYSVLPTTDDHAVIRKQVEFYFSDSNLATDNFLFQKVEGAKNMPVPLKIIHSFKRMQRFQPFSAVVAALKESSTLNVIDVDGEEPLIQRKKPLPAEFESKSYEEIQQVFEDKSMARSVYVKGFGEELPTTQFDIETFFTAHGPTNQVRLRRDLQRNFKGSVFVEFDSEETQKKFLALDPAPQFNGKSLIIKSKKQYCDDKVADIKAGKVRPDGRFGHRGGSNRGKDRQGGRDWRDRRDEDRKNGFRNDKQRGGHRGRGGRDSRGGHRDGRDGGKRDRNEERERENRASGDKETKEEQKAEPTTEEKPATATAAEPERQNAPIPDPSSTSKKRSREDGDDEHEHSEKAGAVKRAREDEKAEDTALASSSAPSAAPAAVSTPPTDSKKRSRDEAEVEAETPAGSASKRAKEAGE